MVVVFEKRVLQPRLGGVGADLVVSPQTLCIWARELFERFAGAASCLVSVLVGLDLRVLGANLLQF